MPERQVSPGEPRPRPDADATGNGNNTGAGQGTRAGGNARRAEPSDATASGEKRAGDTAKSGGDARGNGAAGENFFSLGVDAGELPTKPTAAGAWGSRSVGDAPKGEAGGAGVDAEVTLVLPRMVTSAENAQGPGLVPAFVGPEPATEVIPVTWVAPAAPPAPPPPGVPDPEVEDTGEPRRRWRRFLLISAVVVGALALLYAGDLLLGSGSVPRGVTVAGVDVGGLPLGEADQRLRADLGPRTTQPIPVSVGDATSEIDPVASGLAVDWPGTMAAAGAQPFNPITRITSFFTLRPVAVATTTDHEALNGSLEELAPVVDREPVEGSVLFEGIDPRPVDPVPGQRLDVAAAAGVLERDWANGGTVALPLTELPATTTPEDVTAAIDEVARPAVAAPVTVIGENGVRGTATPEVIASALLFRAENGVLVPELNKQVVQDALAPQMAPSERPGRDATLDFSSGRPVIVPSQDGRGVDYEASFTGLLTVLTGTGPREITAVYADQPAKLTTEKLRSLGITGVIGEFTTGGFAQDSGMNIRRAAEQINRMIVQPGETFSLNQATDPRDAAHGYVEAGIINDGRAGRGIGGGVSQLATTLYNAAYFAGMVDVEHREHSFYISRYPAGREATVYEGLIDLKFRNDGPTGVMIETVWTPTSLTVRLYGTKRYEVTSTAGPRTDPTSPRTVTVPGGEQCIPSQGAPGFTTTDTRTLREISTGQVRTQRRTVRYNPVPIVVCGG